MKSVLLVSISLIGTILCNTQNPAYENFVPPNQRQRPQGNQNRQPNGKDPLQGLREQFNRKEPFHHQNSQDSQQDIKQRIVDFEQKFEGKQSSDGTRYRTQQHPEQSNLNQDQGQSFNMRSDDDHTQQRNFNYNGFDQRYQSFESQNQDLPLVSIVMCSGNRGKYLLEALDSVVMQSYTNWQLLIVDNGSHDPHTLQVLQELSILPDHRLPSGQEVKVSYVSTELTLPSLARNMAFEQAKGKFIAILDDDDLWLPLKLERQMNIMLNDEEAEFVTCNFYAIDPEGKQLGEYPRIDDEQYSIKFQLLMKTIFLHSSVMFRVNERTKPHIYQTFKIGEDYEMWRRLVFEQNFKLRNVPEFLAYYRRHKTQTSKESEERGTYYWIYFSRKFNLHVVYPQVYNDHQTIYDREFQKNIENLCQTDDVAAIANQLHINQNCESLRPSLKILSEEQSQDPYQVNFNKFGYRYEDQSYTAEMLELMQNDFDDLNCLCYQNLKECDLKNTTRMLEKTQLLKQYHKEKESDLMIDYFNNKLIQLKKPILDNQLRPANNECDSFRNLQDFQAPKITIIAKLNDQLRLMSESIQSVLNQTYQNWELVIIDDHVNFQNSIFFLKHLHQKDKDPRIMMIDGSIPSGGDPYANLNHFLQNLETEYVTFLDFDQLMPRDRLCKQITYLQEHPDVDIVGGKYMHVLKDTESMLRKPLDYPAQSTDELKLNMLFSNQLIFSTVMLRNSEKLKPQLFISHLPWAHQQSILLSYLQHEGVSPQEQKELMNVQESYFQKMRDSKLGTESEYDLWFRMIIEANATAQILDEYLVTLRQDTFEIWKVQDNKNNHSRLPDQRQYDLFNDYLSQVIQDEIMLQKLSRNSQQLFDNTYCLLAQNFQGCQVDKSLFLDFLISLYDHFTKQQNERMQYLIKNWMKQVGEAQNQAHLLNSQQKPKAK
eukprot:403356432